MKRCRKSRLRDGAVVIHPVCECDPDVHAVNEVTGYRNYWHYIPFGEGKPAVTLKCACGRRFQATPWRLGVDVDEIAA